MPRPRTVSDEAILDATRAAIDAHGPNVTLEVIAQRVGLTAPGLLRRVRSRDALIERAALPEPPEVVRRMRAGPEPGPTRPQLVALLREACVVFDRFGPALLAWYARSGPVFPEGAPNPLRATREALASWLLAARPALSPARAAGLAEALLGAVEARGLWARIGGPTTLDDGAPDWIERMVDALWPADELTRAAATEPRRG